MPCLDCKHWRMKHSPLRFHGFFRCAMTPATSTTPAHTCNRFTPAPENVVAPRVLWLQKFDALMAAGARVPPPED